MKEKILDQHVISGDEAEITLRPQKLTEYVGQLELKEYVISH